MSTISPASFIGEAVCRNRGMELPDISQFYGKANFNCWHERKKTTLGGIAKSDSTHFAMKENTDQFDNINIILMSMKKSQTCMYR